MERSAHFHPPIAVGRGRFVLWGRMINLSHSRPQNITLRVHRAAGIVHHHTHDHDLAGLGHSSRADEVPRRSAARLTRARWRPRKGLSERRDVCPLSVGPMVGTHTRGSTRKRTDISPPRPQLAPLEKDMFRSPILRNPKTDASRDDSPFPVDRVLGANIAPIDTAVGTPEPPCWSHFLRPMPSRLSDLRSIHVSHDLAIISPNLAPEP